MGLIMYHHSYCNHCYHRYHGVIWMVVPDGHMVMQCCKCGDMELEHREHVTYVPYHAPYVWTGTTHYLPSHLEVTCRPSCESGWSFQRDGVRNGKWV
jgi:hypothetical protein